MSKYGLKMLSICLKRDSITFWSAAEYFTEQVKWASHTAAIQRGQTHLKTQLYPSVKGNATQRNDGHRKEAMREAKSRSRACQASRWNIFVPPGHWGTGTSHPRQPCGTPSTHPCCWAPVDGCSANNSFYTKAKFEQLRVNMICSKSNKLQIIFTLQKEIRYPTSRSE